MTSLIRNQNTCWATTYIYACTSVLSNEVKELQRSSTSTGTARPLQHRSVCLASNVLPRKGTSPPVSAATACSPFPAHAGAEVVRTWTNHLHEVSKYKCFSVKFEPDVSQYQRPVLRHHHTSTAFLFWRTGINRRPGGRGFDSSWCHWNFSST